MSFFKSKLFGFLVLLCAAALSLGIWVNSETKSSNEIPEMMPEPIIVDQATRKPVLAPETGSIEPAEPDAAQVALYFATNRTLASTADVDEADQGSIFASGRSRDLRYGVAKVSIPRDHRMGEMESPGWFSRVLFGAAAFDEDKHVVLQDVDIWDRDKMLAQVRAELGEMDDSAILAFVHGYNTTFTKAARRTGQMKYDLGFDGPTMFFSWPSRGETKAYTVDDETARWSEPHMTEFLRHLTSQGTDKVIVIAHSMGTRLLSRGLAQLIVDDPDAAAKISTVVLAAPDIDAQIFTEQLVPKFRHLARPVTVYVSDSDSALKASKALKGLNRFGDSSNGIVTVDGIDLIDASGAKSDFFGHTYFGDSANILSDILVLLDQGLGVDLRPDLIRVETENGPYWRINLGQ